MTYGDYPDLSGVKKILVAQLRHLGDVLLTSPVLSALKRALPQAEIDVYLYEEAKPMLEGHPAISELIGYDRRWKKQGFFRRLLYEWRLLWKIRQKGYDCVINLTEGDRGAIAARLARAKIRVGIVPSKLYTHVVKQGPNPRHRVEKNLDAVRRIGVFPAWEERELTFYVPTSAQRAVPAGPFVLIHPTSRWRFKCWPTAKMRLLIEWLLQEGKRVVLSSGPDPIEVEMVTEISQGLNVVSLAGKVSLKELGALIDSAELLVCVDSVPFHMASALKRPVVALFGPTSDVAWGPWRNPHARVVAQPLPCRPCYQDGCGGSKYSDCLHTLPLRSVQEVILSMQVSNNKVLTK